jgi:hypothetical protein
MYVSVCPCPVSFAQIFRPKDELPASLFDALINALIPHNACNRLVFDALNRALV